VTVQVSQIQTPEPSLYQETYAPTPSSNNFQRYLNEEQKKISLFFSPLAQFDFASWFQYPGFSQSSNPVGSHKVQLFSDIPINQGETDQANQPAPQNLQLNQAHSSQPQADQFAYYFASSPKQTMADILAQTGWLVPNIEAQPLLSQAQSDGKMLNKFDLQSLVDQILSQVQLVKDKGRAELSVGLKPENLGELLLILTSRSGMISIEIQIQDENRKLLEDALTELELALKKANVNFDNIIVSNLKEVKQDEHA